MLNMKNIKGIDSSKGCTGEIRSLTLEEIAAVAGAGAGGIWGDGCIPPKTKPKTTTKLPNLGSSNRT